jgi:hypothetical protein
MSGFEWLFGAGAGGTTAAGTGVTAGGLGSGAIGTGLTASELAAAGATSQVAASGAAAAGAATYGGLTAAQWANIGSQVLQTGAQVGQNVGSANQANTLANAALSQARQEEFVDRRRSTALIAKQKAAGAAAGLDIASGTPNELLLDSAYNAELNALNIRKQGRFNADYYKTQARRSKAQIPGMIFGGLLSGYGNYAKMKGP